MTTSRTSIASIRKDQIVEAAVAVIAEQGLPNLSLSEIEQKVGMRRGQLTYYFKHKEDILLAVFDRVLQLTYERLGRPSEVDGDDGPQSGWAMAQYLLEALLTKPPLSPEFHCLQYTFLSQIGYREDFRQRLATLYEEWRIEDGRRPGGGPCQAQRPSQDARAGAGQLDPGAAPRPDHASGRRPQGL